MDAPVFWRTTLNIAASFKKRATSLVKNLHVQLHLQKQKRAKRKVKGKMKLGLWERHIQCCYQTTQEWIKKYMSVHNPAVGSGLPNQYTSPVCFVAEDQERRCVWGQHSGGDGMGTWTWPLREGSNAGIFYVHPLNCRAKLLLWVCLVPVLDLTATCGLFRHRRAFQIASKCMSLSLQEESLWLLYIVLSPAALQCSLYQVIQSY